VTCKTKKKKQQKKGCPYKSKTVTTTFARVALNLVKPFKKKKLRVGTKITVTVSGSSFIGKVFKLAVRKKNVPSVKTLCIAPGAKAASCV
jgi:hypothetical protein